MTPLEFLIEAKAKGLKVPAELLCFGFALAYGHFPSLDEAKAMGAGRTAYFNAKRLHHVQEAVSPVVRTPHDHGHALSERGLKHGSPSLREGMEHEPAEIPDSEPALPEPMPDELLQLQRDLLDAGIGKKPRNFLVPVDLSDPETYYIDYDTVARLIAKYGYHRVREQFDYVRERKHRGESVNVAKLTCWGLKHGAKPPVGFWEARQEVTATQIPDNDSEVRRFEPTPEAVITEAMQRHEADPLRDEAEAQRTAMRRNQVVLTLKMKVEAALRSIKRIPAQLRDEIERVAHAYGFPPELVLPAGMTA